MGGREGDVQILTKPAAIVIAHSLGIADSLRQGEGESQEGSGGEAKYYP